MTATLRHAIKISAPRDRVFHALTDIAQMAAWQVGSVDGDITVGSSFYLRPKPGLMFGWRTDEIVLNERIRQVCIEGPRNSTGKTLELRLSDDDMGTLLTLTDGDWLEDDPDLPFCNTRWAESLLRLKQFVETGTR